MQNEKVFEDTCRYFGYDPGEISEQECRLIPEDEFMPWLRKVYTFVREGKLARKASRIVMDHDPRCPFALIRVITDRAVYFSFEQGLRLHELTDQPKGCPCLEEYLGHTGLDQSIRETLGLPE